MLLKNAWIQSKFLSVSSSSFLFLSLSDCQKVAWWGRRDSSGIDNVRDFAEILLASDCRSINTEFFATHTHTRARARAHTHTHTHTHTEDIENKLNSLVCLYMYLRQKVGHNNVNKPCAFHVSYVSEETKKFRRLVIVCKHYFVSKLFPSFLLFLPQYWHSKTREFILKPEFQKNIFSLLNSLCQHHVTYFKAPYLNLYLVVHMW